jgi:hypothetical protein
MDYTVPNFGEYGYIEPKSGFNWQVILFFIVVVFSVGGTIYLLSKKEEEEKEKSIDSPNISKPYALA